MSLWLEVCFFFFFSDDFTDKWVLSKSKSDYGKFTITAGDFYGDAELDKGRCEWTSTVDRLEMRVHWLFT